MRNNGNEPGSQYPNVEMFLKKLAKNKRLSKNRVVCESDGVVMEYWLEGGEVLSRAGLSAGQAAPSLAAFAAAAESGFLALVPQLERELGGKEVAGLNGIEIAIRDVTHSSAATMCKSLLEQVDQAPELGQLKGACSDVATLDPRAWRGNAAVRAGCCYGERPGVDRAYVEVDGTGVPMRRSETEGIKGKQKDGSARTREAKVIVTFTADGRHPKTGATMKGKNNDAVSARIVRAATVGRVSGASEFAKRL